MLPRRSVHREEVKELQSSVGRHIETLGFLSTTLSKQTALGFIGNSLLEIEVSELPKDEEVDWGFAHLTEEYSCKDHEK